MARGLGRDSGSAAADASRRIAAILITARLLADWMWRCGMAFPPSAKRMQAMDGCIRAKLELDLPDSLETGTAEADAILDVAVVSLARRRLAEETVVDLEETAHPDQGQLLRLPLEILEAVPRLIQADVEVADLARIEDGVARAVAAKPLEPAQPE